MATSGELMTKALRLAYIIGRNDGLREAVGRRREIEGEAGMLATVNKALGANQ